MSSSTAPMKLVIFDCDGTLVDSQHAICAAMEHAFTTLDLRPPSRREILGVVGLSLPQLFAVLAGEQPQSVQAELIRLYRADFPGKREGAAAHDPLYAGVGEAVKAWRAATISSSALPPANRAGAWRASWSARAGTGIS